MTSTELVRIDDATARERHARRIHDLMAKWSQHTMALGKELKEAQETFPLERMIQKGRPVLVRLGWNQWLKAEFGITPQWANTLMHVHEKLSRYGDDLPMAGTVMIQLAKSATRESARREIVDRSRRGERITTREAKKIITKHLPKPSEANKQARATGKPVAASDGYIYFGANKEEASKIEQRRGVVFAVRRAIETLATMEVTPLQFLDYALPHQLHKFDEGGRLHRATKWLNALNDAWDNKK